MHFAAPELYMTDEVGRILVQALMEVLKSRDSSQRLRQQKSWHGRSPTRTQLWDWLRHPAGGKLPAVDGTDQPSTGQRDSICGHRYMPPDAEKTFNSFQFAAGFASAPKLFARAAKSWPPPFIQRKGSLDDALNYIKGLSKGNRDDSKGKPKDSDEAAKTTPDATPKQATT